MDIHLLRQKSKLAADKIARKKERERWEKESREHEEARQIIRDMEKPCFEAALKGEYSAVVYILKEGEDYLKGVSKLSHLERAWAGKSHRVTCLMALLKGEGFEVSYVVVNRIYTATEVKRVFGIRIDWSEREIITPAPEPKKSFWQRLWK